MAANTIYLRSVPPANPAQIRLYDPTQPDAIVGGSTSLVWKQIDLTQSLYFAGARAPIAQPQPFYLSNNPPPAAVSFPPIAFAPMAHMLIR